MLVLAGWIRSAGGQPQPAGAANAMENAKGPGVPISRIYEVTATRGSSSREIAVFQSSCPRYRPGYQNMRPVDRNPLRRFEGATINWTSFAISNEVTVKVHVLEPDKVPLDGPVRIFPSRCGIQATGAGGEISFKVSRPGQYSVEIGDNGHRNGLLIFADPPETDRPDPAGDGYYVFNHATPGKINSAPAACTGIYFKSGVHDIGVYRVPAHIKNIYFEPGAWVYGAIVLDDCPGVKIFGRGVLSEARLNYRESHAVEAVHHSDRIDLEGIVLADTKFFAVRLLGTNNTVKWVKVVGGWTYNTDGIAAFGGSTVQHCFIRANDDSLKPYASNLSISDCMVWQLNNGAVIQLGWGNAKATNVIISNLDVLRADWNNEAPNRGILSCVGDKFAKGGMLGVQRGFVIKNVTTETPAPFILNIRPNPASPDEMHGMVLKNWNVKMNMDLGYSNDIECADATNKFDGLVFDHFRLNGKELTKTNWLAAGRFVIRNVAMPRFVSPGSEGAK